MKRISDETIDAVREGDPPPVVPPGSILRQWLFRGAIVVVIVLGLRFFFAKSAEKLKVESVAAAQAVKPEMSRLLGVPETRREVGWEVRFVTPQMVGVAVSGMVFDVPLGRKIYVPDVGDVEYRGMLGPGLISVWVEGKQREVVLGRRDEPGQTGAAVGRGRTNPASDRIDHAPKSGVGS